MGGYVNAKQLAKRFMSKGKDKIRLSTIINEIEIAEKGLSREVDKVDVVRCKNCVMWGNQDHNTNACNLHNMATYDTDFCSYGKAAAGGVKQ